GDERTPHVAQGGAGQHEEHGAEAGGGAIVRTFQVPRLDVGDEERDVVDPRRVLGGAANEVLGAVDARDAAGWAYQACQLASGVAEATPDVEHPGTSRRRMSAQGLVAVVRKAFGQKVLKPAELVEQDGVPGLDDDVVFALCRVHGAPSWSQG